MKNLLNSMIRKIQKQANNKYMPQKQTNKKCQRNHSPYSEIPHTDPTETALVTWVNEKVLMGYRVELEAQLNAHPQGFYRIPESLDNDKTIR